MAKYKVGDKFVGKYGTFKIIRYNSARSILVKFINRVGMTVFLSKWR